MALAAAAAAYLRQLSLRQSNEEGQTVVYLTLGALIGVGYSLGTEKFIRAMHHRHIFVRNSMLWLSATAWMFAALAVGFVAAAIYRQTDGGLEGYDRVLGVLIPFVVRADLIVDWARRVAWALLNMENWTTAAVQVRRMVLRYEEMYNVVQVEVDGIGNADLGRELEIGERRLWEEDRDSLTRGQDVWKHFQKLGRVAIYAVCGILLAAPGGLFWVIYAVWESGKAVRDGKGWRVLLCLLSIVLTPVGVVICVMACAGLLGAVVSLSFVGTIIQWIVYWSTRTVYGMVRVGVSRTWAGWGAKGRKAEEAGAAIAWGGGLLPTEIEFALASWDGYRTGEGVGKGWMENLVAKLKMMGGTEEEEDYEEEQGGVKRMGSVQRAVTESSDSEAKDQAEILLGRLGLDVFVKSGRRRRLSTFYAFGMLCHLQVESGGNAWKLLETREINDDEFKHRLQKLGNDVGEEAAVALDELAARLKGTSRYRLVPTGTEGVVGVKMWLRNALLAFLETPQHCESA